MSRQVLKPIWIECLNELFEKATTRNDAYVTVSAEKLRDMAKERNLVENPERFPSIGYAMRSIEEAGDEESGLYQSTTFAVKYKLPRSFNRINETIPDSKDENDSDSGSGPGDNIPNLIPGTIPYPTRLSEKCRHRAVHHKQFARK